MEFAYNNSYQASIGMTSYEALYERKYRTPICWDEVGERKLNKVELIEVTSEKIRIIRERLKIRSIEDLHGHSKKGIRIRSRRHGVF